MTIPVELAAQIQRLYRVEKWPIGTIARHLHIHHSVVRRVLGIGPKMQRPDGRPTLLCGYEEFIRQTLLTYPELCATRVFDMVRERGFVGSARTVRRLVSHLRPRASKPVFLRTSTLPGEQAQVDWAHVGRVRVPGGERALWLFVLVLGHSRAMWAEFVLDLSVHSLVRSLVRASVALGGSPRQWLFDNPKTVVLQRHGDATRFHPALLEVAGKLCVSPRLCGVRKPHEKGKVERSIRYLRDRFLAGRTIASVAEGNAALTRFITEVAHQRPHPDTPQQRVQDIFEEEQPRLLRLPAVVPPTDEIAPCHVDATAFVRFDTNLYSVPPEYASQTLTRRADDQVVRLLCGDVEVARHARCFGRHQRIEDILHRKSLLRQRKAARLGKTREHLFALIPAAEKLVEAAVEAGRNAGFTIRDLGRLLDLYGADILRVAVEEACARGVHDVGALTVLCEQRRKQTGAPVHTSVQFSPHIPDRDVIPHALESYDADD